MAQKEDIHTLISRKEYVALAVIGGSKYQKTNISIVKHLSSQKIPGVYVTLNRPYQNVKELLTKEKVSLNNIIFIDAVSKTAGGELTKTEECLFIGSPENLSEMALAMDQAIMAIPKKDKFLFFDSLSTILLYNDVKVVARFIHFLSTKMRVWKVKGIIISLRREKDKELISELKEFCDITLDL